MAREYSFKDTYVGILGGIDDLFDYEPYERDFNEEYQWGSKIKSINRPIVTELIYSRTVSAKMLSI